MARIERMGRWIEADSVFTAWTSGDLPKMLAARSVRTNPIDRHFLLQSIVKDTYRRRNEPEMRRLCIETGLLHLNELPVIAEALRADFGGELPRIPAFAWLATALAEDGRVDDAIDVCNSAAQFGLEDGTKSGYLGRAKRLAKRKTSARSAGNRSRHSTVNSPQSRASRLETNKSPTSPRTGCVLAVATLVTGASLIGALNLLAHLWPPI